MMVAAATMINVAVTFKRFNFMNVLLIALGRTVDQFPLTVFARAQQMASLEDELLLYLHLLPSTILLLTLGFTIVDTKLLFTTKRLKHA